MPHFELPDGCLHYQDFGKGPCIAFLHGSGGNHLSWWQQIPLLSRHYRCVVPDLRGFGLSRSEAPPCDPLVFGTDLLALLDHLNIESVHLVGQSIGGSYALRFALTHPQRVHALVLADTLAGISDDGIDAVRKAAAPIPDRLLERALGKQFRLHSEQLTFLYQAFERLNHADRTPEVLAPPDIGAAELARLKAPTLFLVGEHDPVAPPAAVKVAASMVAGAIFRVIPGCGHSAYFERPDAFNDALLEFLSALAQPVNRL